MKTDPLDIAIRPADIHEAQALLDLQKLAYRSEAEIYDDDSIAPLTQTLEEMKADFERQTILTATLNGRIAGSVRGYLSNGTCHIGRLIVDPQLQNRGVGTSLLQALEQHFSGAARYELFTGHRSERNLYLYQKLGYAPVRQEKITNSVTHVYLEKVIKK